jgi:hypothetical protein
VRRAGFVVAFIMVLAVVAVGTAWPGGALAGPPATSSFRADTAPPAPDRFFERERLGAESEPASLGAGIRSISGTVRGPGGVALADVAVDAYDVVSGDLVATGWTAANGTYTISGLDPAQYYIGTWNDQNYIDEWYDNVIMQGNLSAEGATVVDVSAANATNRNFQLAAGRSISGTVTGPGGLPLANAVVEAYDLEGVWTGLYAFTAANGTYKISGLVPGSYHIGTWNDQNYVDEWYNDVTRQGHPDAEGATAVNVSSVNATGRNFQLAAGRFIAGTVTGPGATPIEDAVVEVYELDGDWTGCYEYTAANGSYSILGLLPGSYYIGTWNDQNYVDEWYNDVTRQGHLNAEGATVVDVSGANATGRNFQLATGRSISGTVTADGGAPIEYAWVEVYELDGSYTGCGEWSLPPSGDYVVTGLLPGTYYVRTWTRSYLDEWFYDVPAADDDSPPPGGVTGVDVSTLDITAIDFQLQPIVVTYTSYRGTDRYHTALLLSQAAFPAQLPPGSGVVLAPGATFPEALCGAPLAAAYGGPVLLTGTTALYSTVATELKRLNPKYVFCIGLSAGVATAVQTALPAATVTSIGGSTIYHMSRNVANALKARVNATGGDITKAVGLLTIGTKFPDALGLGPLACVKKWPIILTDQSGWGTSLHAEATATFTDLGLTQMIKVGTYSGPPAGVVGVAPVSRAGRDVAVGVGRCGRKTTFQTAAWPPSESKWFADPYEPPV